MSESVGSERSVAVVDADATSLPECYPGLLRISCRQVVCVTKAAQKTLVMAVGCNSTK